MWTISCRNGQQHIHLLILFDPNNRLHELLILHSKGILEGVKLLIDKSVVLEQAFVLKGV